jgi:head-tail adaptor
VIGTMSERVTVQTRTLVNDGGTPVETWANVAALTRVAARVTTAGASRVERILGAQVQGQTSHLVELPMPDADVALTSRVQWHSRWGDRVLDVVGKVQQQDARRRWLVLACEEARTS